MQSARSRWTQPATFALLTAGLAWLIAHHFDVQVRWVGPVDFATYRLGGLGAWSGADIYATAPDGPPPFTYTPFAALLFGPLAWLPEPVGVTVWSAATVAVLAGSLWLVSGSRALPGQPPMQHRIPLLLGLTVVACYGEIGRNHLAFGQIGALLMFLVLADAVRSPDSRLGRALPPGVLVGLAAAIKLTPALFIVFFVLVRRWRMAAAATISAATATGVAAVLRPDLSRAFVDLLPHLGERVSLGPHDAGSGNQTVAGIGLALGLPVVAVVASIAVGIAGLLAARRVLAGGGLAVALVFVGLLATAVSPIGWKHHWVYIFPALVLLWRVSAVKGRVLAGALIAASAGNGPDSAGGLLAGNLAEQALGWVVRESILLCGVALMIWLYLVFGRAGAKDRTPPRSAAPTPPTAGATAADRATTRSTATAPPGHGSA